MYKSLQSAGWATTSLTEPPLHPHTTRLLNHTLLSKSSCRGPHPQLVEDHVHRVLIILDLARTKHPRIPLFP